jgi:hypothetical protein
MKNPPGRLSLPSSMVTCLTVALFFVSCTTVKEYQKNKLNDAEMQLSSRKIEKTELNFQSYREGASGANGGKTGGGCGCN